jgi:hypothetical protein
MAEPQFLPNADDNETHENALLDESEAQASETDSQDDTNDSLDNDETSLTAEASSEPEYDPEPSEPASTQGAFSEQRVRKWHFQPDIHMTIADQKLPMLLNPQTGELEMTSPLRLDKTTLVSFLEGLADGELAGLTKSIDALGHFVSVEMFTLTALHVSPTGDMSFNLAAHPESKSDRNFPAMAFENIRFTVSRGSQS